MSLMGKLNALYKNRAISMHVPGHKNMTIGHLDQLEWYHDMTEITGLDNLHSPEGVLLGLNDLLSSKYEGYHAQLVVNGTTTGILSAVFAVKDGVDQFFVVDDAHKSVYHGLDLSAAPFKNITSADVLHADLKNMAVVITYPTYSGDATGDLEGIIRAVHSKGGIVIIDEAHGAHNDISTGFLPSSMNYGADIVIQSYHKMLPALTGASVIFTDDDGIHEKIMKYIDYFETSSPSYLIMASIELAQQFYNDFEDEAFFKRRAELITVLNNLGFSVHKADDPAKITININGVSPYRLFDALDQAGVYSEMVTEEGVLWCLPLFHEGDSYPSELLFERLNKLSLTQSEMSIGDTEDLGFLLGKAAVRSVVPYPPGVPIIREGDRFTEEVIKSITHKKFYHVKIEGIEENIECYKVEDEV